VGPDKEDAPLDVRDIVVLWWGPGVGGRQERAVAKAGALLTWCAATASGARAGFGLPVAPWSLDCAWCGLDPTL